MSLNHISHSISVVCPLQESFQTETWFQVSRHRVELLRERLHCHQIFHACYPCYLSGKESMRRQFVDHQRTQLFLPRYKNLHSVPDDVVPPMGHTRVWTLHKMCFHDGHKSGNTIRS